MTKVITWLATWFGLGRLRPAPGTWGTLGAVPLVVVLREFGEIVYLVAASGLVVLAMAAAHLYQQAVATEDPSEVVIDEVVGFVIAMAWLPPTWQAWLAAFVLFRLLDAVKPWLIGWLDRRLRGGVGIVADDVTAGVLTNALLQWLFVQTSWLGYQLPS